MNVILAIVMMELTKENVYCTGNITWFKHCGRIMKLKCNILVGMNVSVVMVMMELTTENLYCTGNIT